MGCSGIGRRRFLQRAVLAGGAFFLTGCAQPAKTLPSEAAPVATSAAPVTAAPEQTAALRILWRTNPEENSMLDELIEAFQQKNPGASVEQIVVPWAEYEPRLLSEFAAGTAPDIYGTGGANPWIERAYRGMVLTLDAYVEREGEAFTAGLWPIALNSYRVRGKLIALTHSLIEAGVFVNATRFDEAGVRYPTIDWTNPWTWEEMLEAARQLTYAEQGAAGAFGINLVHHTPWYYTRLWGGDLVSPEDYDSGLLRRWQTDKVNYEACVAGLQARADAILKERVMPDQATAAALAAIGPLLKTGAVAMEFTGGWTLWGGLPEQARLRAAANPRGGTHGSGTTCRNCWSDPLQISAQARDADLAWAFARLMVLDPEAIRIQIRHRAAIPAARAALEPYLEQHGRQLAMTIEEQRQFFAGALEQAETSVPDHILVGAAAIRDMVISELDPVWKGERTARQAIDTLIPQVNVRLAAYLESLNLT